MSSAQKYVVWFHEVDKKSIPLVGGKGANLGEMTLAGLPVPPGFIVTSNSYYEFIKENNLKPKIEEILKKVDVNNSKELQNKTKEVRKLIVAQPIPKKIADQIINFYFSLSLANSKNIPKLSLVDRLTAHLKVHTLPVAVRSSATAEDLPEASFAGQQATYLNIKGEANVLSAVKKAWASLFTARAVFYRAQNGFDHFKVGIAIPVQKMVQSDVSGIMFTIDPLTNNKQTIVIEAIFGLGELIVQGSITPEQHIVDKKTNKIISSKYVRQDTYLPGFGKQEVNLPKKLINDKKLSRSTVIKLAEYGKKLERHYYFPQDIEWAMQNGIIYIVQTRPITTIKDKEETDGALHKQLSKLTLIAQGSGASPGIASGTPKVVHSPSMLSIVHEGDVLVAEQTNPDFVPAMKKASAIVTEKGGKTSHAAIVSRELGLPAVVGATGSILKTKHEQTITVDGSEGKIYRGSIHFSNAPVSLDRFPKDTRHFDTATHIYTNLAEVERAVEISKLHVDGVGLLRAEFMIAAFGMHPKHAIKLKKQKTYIQHLSESLLVFCKAFGQNRPVIYRTTDFKTNEYKNLKFGHLYENDEENPMIGYRGASRYILDPDVFELELEAIKIVRNKMGYKNLHVMIPFVRTPEELIKTKRLMAASGLTRNHSFHLFLMVEIPSNVILIDEFIKTGIDGISIGSNDLTQLTLGVDRDNNVVAGDFEERNPAVLWSLEHVIKAANKHRIKSSICGQAPSNYPELVEQLVRWGITSISVNPDVIEQVRKKVWEVEQNIVNKK
jgi:pyruvate,water dikinase